MSFKPQRTFVGSEGEYSRDYSGPEAIKSDLESLMRMFDPNSTHSDGSQGGITFDNLSISFEDSAMSEKVGSADIEGLTAANNVYAQLVAIVQILTSKSNLSASDTLKFIGGTLNEEASNAQAIVDSLYNLVIDRYTKEQSDANLKAKTDNLIKSLTYNDETGVLTATYADGTSAEIFDLNVEKIPASIDLVEDGSVIYLRITNTDGTYTQSDVTRLLTQYSFTDTDTVAMSVENGAVHAEVKDGSVTRAKLSAGMLSDLTNAERNAGLSADSASASAESASASAGLASVSATLAENHADDARGYSDSASANASASAVSASTASGYSTSAKSYAIGGTGTRTGENTDNAKYYAQQASASKTAAENAANSAATTVLANVDNKVREAEATISGAVGSAENSLNSIASVAETTINSSVSNARAELQSYVSSAEDSAETAEYWAKQAEESAGGDFVTNTVFNTQMGTKADLVDGKVKADQLPEGGGSFEIKITIDADENVTVDKTFEEVHTAIIEGKYVYATSEDFPDVYHVTDCSDFSITLSNTFVDITDFDIKNVYTSFSYLAIMTNNRVYFDYLNGEIPQSLVYEIGESSSNTEVPTALAVKNAIAGVTAFVVNFTNVGSDDVVINSDKTFAQISEALASGKSVYGKLAGTYENRIFEVTSHSTRSVEFSSQYKSINNVGIVYAETTTISISNSNVITYKFAESELPADVTYEIDEYSTDSQVPTALAVKNAIEEASGGGTFVVTTTLPHNPTINATTNITLSATFDQIKQAIADGKTVYCFDDNYSRVLEMAINSSYTITFKAHDISENITTDGVPQSYFATHTITVSQNASRYTKNASYMVAGGVIKTLDTPREFAVPTCQTVKTAIDTAVGKTIGFDNAVTTILADSLKADSYTIEFTEDSGEPTIVQGSVTFTSQPAVQKDIDVGFKPDLVIASYASQSTAGAFSQAGHVFYTKSGSYRMRFGADDHSFVDFGDEMITDNGFTFHIQASGQVITVKYTAIQF